MLTQIDIYRSAKLLIDMHGAEKAPAEAARMFDLMIDRNDVDGQRVWRLIQDAINELAVGRAAKAGH